MNQLGKDPVPATHGLSEEMDQSSCQLVRTIADLKSAVSKYQAQGRSIGLVPTMGALHEGHLSLARHSLVEADVTIATIFVNPTQFSPDEDLAKYPRTLDQDFQLLESLGVDLVFAPTAEEIYPNGCSTVVHPPAVATTLEGAHRETHFQGVTTIVAKLFNLTEADFAYFGQKDFQQSLVIQRMVIDLNMPIEIRVCPIIRDEDGLAMSSRNRYLTAEERARALAISQTLGGLDDKIEALDRDSEAVQNWMRQQLEAAGITEIDYALVADANTLEVKNRIEIPAVGLIAARVGSTRLIDNRLIVEAANQ